MMGTTHRTGSITLALAMEAYIPLAGKYIPPRVTEFIYFPTNNSVLLAVSFVLAAAVGGLIPDVDTPFSTAGRALRFVLLPMYLIKKLLFLLGTFLKPLRKISKAMGHRGIFHSPLLWLIIFAILSALTHNCGTFTACVLSGLFWGIMSHIFLDYLAGGVPLLAPFTMKRFHPFIFIKTGGFLEVLVNIGFILSSVYFGYVSLVHFTSPPLL